MAYDTIASQETIEKTIAELKARNVEAEIAESKEAAFARMKELIPQGASVAGGASRTLDEIGFGEYLISGEHPWKNLKADYVAEKDPAKQMKLRRESSLADFYVGSVHAVAETGQILIASNTGSQLPGYLYSSPNVIWVVGAQKIVPNLDEAIKRLHEYVMPLEDERMKSVGAAGTSLGKWVVFEKESPYNQRKVRLIFVKEKLGF